MHCTYTKRGLFSRFFWQSISLQLLSPFLAVPLFCFSLLFFYHEMLCRARLCDSMSSLSVRLWRSAFRYRDHIGWNTCTSKIISRPNSLRYLFMHITPTWAIWCKGTSTPPKICYTPIISPRTGLYIRVGSFSFLIKFSYVDLFPRRLTHPTVITDQ